MWIRRTDAAGLVGQAVATEAFLVGVTACSDSFLLNTSGRVGVAVETNLAIVAA